MHDGTIVLLNQPRSKLGRDLNIELEQSSFQLGQRWKCEEGNSHCCCELRVLFDVAERRIFLLFSLFLPSHTLEHSKSHQDLSHNCKRKSRQEAPAKWQENLLQELKRRLDRATQYYCVVVLSSFVVSCWYVLLNKIKDLDVLVYIGDCGPKLNSSYNFDWAFHSSFILCS